VSIKRAVHLDLIWEQCISGARNMTSTVKADIKRTYKFNIKYIYIFRISNKTALRVSYILSAKSHYGKCAEIMKSRRYIYGSTALCWTLVNWTGDQPVTWPLPAHRIAQTQNKRTQTFMPQVGLEPTIPVLEWAKTVHASDRAATLIGRRRQLCSIIINAQSLLVAQ
jgi:hypothetical protein